MHIRKEKNFISVFNEKTGEYFRSGIIKNGKDTGIDPFMTSFPELLDVGIMGHCIHGKKGLCIKSGVQCYQNGLNTDRPNMTLKDFESIISECKGRTFQIALGGCGDPDQHEHFEDILKMCHGNGIVPNFTTSGFGLDEKKAELCKKYCGAVAVSWYRSEYTYKAVDMLIRAGCKTNIHFVLSRTSLAEAIVRLEQSLDNISAVPSVRFSSSEQGFPRGINALVFLLHKPVGLGTVHEMLDLENSMAYRLTNLIDTNKFPFKIGFDSCSVPMLMNMKNVDPVSFDTCEAARWSAYISPDMKMMPCSFDNQQEKWAVSLRKYSIQEAWESELFNEFREHFQYSCPECADRSICLGGCPIIPEIVLCRRNERIAGA